MIDAVAVYFAGVNIFKRQLNAVVHVKGTLRLADQAEIGVVHQDMGNDSNLLIVFYVQIMPDDLVMQLHRF